jgi:hypothetical protein
MNMMIREIEKTLEPRGNRGNKKINPLRKSAQELGFVLKELSEAVQSTKKRKSDDKDSLETPYGGASRSFKLSNAKDDSEQNQALPFKLNFNEEQAQAVNLLKEARKLAADASLSKLSIGERNALTERFQTVFKELSEKCPQTLASLQKEENETNGAQLSVSSDQSAAGAFLSIEEMIVKIFEIGARRHEGEPAEQNETPQHSDLKTALGASGQIKELFLTEGAAKTFGRFQEIDRSNVLGLLK